MNFFKKKAKILLSVEEAKDRLYREISEHLGWKFLKSQQSFKKVVNNLVFEIQFYSSKWNSSNENIEIQCELRLWCKKFDKIDKNCTDIYKENNVHSSVGFYAFTPPAGSWWNVTYDTDLSDVIKQLCDQFDEIAIPFYNQFETDFDKAVQMLSDEKIFNQYNISFKFIDHYAGRDYIVELAQKYYNSLSSVCKQDIVNYKNGATDKSWMINPSNLKYIIDNGII